jgi:serine/threonine-protein kinase
VPRTVEQAIEKALAKVPADRWPTAAQFAGALETPLTASQGSVRPREAMTTSADRGILEEPESTLRPGLVRRLLGLAGGLIAWMGSFVWWSHWRRIMLGALVLVGLVVLAVAARRFLPAGGIPTDAQSIVVLPFKNLGAPADQYFTDGLTEEITTRLSGLSGLRVIARPSADQYRSTSKTVKQIAAELDVHYILVGSVRWERSAAGRSRVRFTPQLIRVADGSYLWAGSYDAEVTEVFKIQSDMAQRLTTILDVKLLAPERATLAAGGTRNPDAYDFYLRGNEYMARSYARADLEAAVDLYNKAVGLDSAFSLALARLARAQTAMYWFYHDRSPARLETARRAVDAAIRVTPDLAEAHIAFGYWYYWGQRDYTSALEHFEAARRQQPSNSELLSAMGYVERRQGRWVEAVAHLAEALRYDPRSQLRTLHLADTHMWVRNYLEAERLFDRTIQLAPDWADPYAYKATLYLVWRGDRDLARGTIEQALTRVGIGWLAQALSIHDGISASLLTADSLFAPSVNALGPASIEGDTARFFLLRAEAAHFSGDWAAERAYGDSARRLMERRVREQAGDPKQLVRLGLAYARLGRKADAIRAGLRAAKLLPPAADATSGPAILIHLAQIYSLVSEPGEALATLEPLLSIPSLISPEELRSDPIWESLRDHPRFRKLLNRRDTAMVSLGEKRR